MRNLYNFFLLGFLAAFACGSMFAMPVKPGLKITSSKQTQADPKNRRYKKQKQSKTLWQKLKWPVITTTTLIAIIVGARLLNKPKPQRRPTPPPAPLPANATPIAADETCTFCAGSGFVMIDGGRECCLSCAPPPTGPVPDAAQMPLAAACDLCGGVGFIDISGEPNELCPNENCPQRPTSPPLPAVAVDSILESRAFREGQRRAYELAVANDTTIIQKERNAVRKKAQDLLEAAQHTAREEIKNKYAEEYTLILHKASHANFLRKQKNKSEQAQRAALAPPAEALATPPTPAPAPRSAKEELVAAAQKARIAIHHEEQSAIFQIKQLIGNITATRALMAQHQTTLATVEALLDKTEKPTKIFAEKILSERIDKAEKQLSDKEKATVLDKFKTMNATEFSAWLQKNAPAIFTAWDKELKTARERWQELKAQQQQFAVAVQSTENYLASLQTEVIVKHE